MIDTGQNVAFVDVIRVFRLVQRLFILFDLVLFVRSKEVISIEHKVNKLHLIQYNLFTI